MDDLKDHQIAEVVNTLRDIAVEFHSAQQLRERIAHVIVPLLSRRAVPQANAEQHTLKLARYDWLFSNFFIFEFFSGAAANTSIATSYCYSGSDEGFAQWVESQIDAAIRAASKTTPSSGEGE